MDLIMYEKSVGRTLNPKSREPTKKEEGQA